MAVIEGQRVRQPVEDILRHRHVLRERPVPAVIAAGHTQYLPVVAQIDFAAAAEVAASAGYRRIERHAVAHLPILDAPAGLGDRPGCLVTHYQRRNSSPC